MSSSLLVQRLSALRWFSCDGVRSFAWSCWDDSSSCPKAARATRKALALIPISTIIDKSRLHSSTQNEGFECYRLLTTTIREDIAKATT
jgi:hypothetical protein